MKRILCLILSLLLLCSCAAAEWTCPDPACGKTWSDTETVCSECGWEAPLHGLTVTMAGDHILRLQWYGYMADPVDLYYRVKGVDSWTLCGTTDKHSYNAENLTEGTVYEFQLMDWNSTPLTVDGTTTMNGVSLSNITALYDEAVARVAQLEADLAERDAIIAAQQATIDEQAAALAATETTIASQQAIIDAQAGAHDDTPAATPKPARVTAKVGQYITYGHYPQTAEGTDSTPIEWLVLDVQGNKALVISRYGLDALRFDNGQYQGWEKSEIRSWLNGTFLYKAFTTDEQACIVTTRISTPKYGGTKGGSDTEDKVWLLSSEEATAYFAGDSARQVTPTAYAVARGAGQYSGTDKAQMLDGIGCCWWWLRSPGDRKDSASRINSDGSLYRLNVNRTSGSVRPALWLDLDTAELQ